MMDQKTEPSSVAMTSGYTTKTSPGPKNIKQNIKHNSYGVYNSLPNSVQNRQVHFCTSSQLVASTQLANEFQYKQILSSLYFILNLWIIQQIILPLVGRFSMDTP